MTLAGVRILLAEDNPTNQLVAAQMLESLGASVTLARDGAEALEIAEQNNFDVMLIDIEMPRVGGIEVMRRIRQTSAPRAETPMIALTAYVMREHRASIEAAGSDGIIAKPITSIEEFGADIKRYMSRRTGKAKDESGNGLATTHVGTAAVDRGTYDSLAEAIGVTAMAELLDKVEADLVSARDGLQHGCESGAMDQVRSATHVLISVAGAVGATRVQESAKRVNDIAAKAENPSAVGCETASLLDELERVLDFVRSERGG